MPKSTAEEVNDIVSIYENNMGPRLLFITVTLTPKLYKYQSLTQYELSVNDLKQILLNRCLKASYSTELTNDGNVHYHGIVLVYDKVARLSLIDAIKRSRTFGFMKITPSPIECRDQLVRSANYLCKDLDTTRKFICRKGYNPDIIISI